MAAFPNASFSPQVVSCTACTSVAPMAGSMYCVSIWVSLARLACGVKGKSEEMEEGGEEAKKAVERESDEVMHRTF
jgi:hypothetical protein